jgi:uncharacterized protein YggE
MQPLEIVVRGSARRRYPAERATVRLTAQYDGTDRQEVHRRAVGVHEPLTSEIADLAEAGAVTRWNSDQLRVFTYRPVDSRGARRRMFQVAIGVEAEFVDFEKLSAFLDRWAAEEGVDVGHTSWDVTEEHRAAYEADLRREAVADATAKAQAFADAAGRGRVTAVQLADPGMLSAAFAGDDGAPRMRTMMAAMDSGGPTLDLRPDDITLSASVDAKFVAE